MPVTIRAVQESDKPDWCRLWDAYLAFYRTSRDQSVKDMTFARTLNDAELMWSFLAHDTEGRAVGMVNFLYHRNFWQEGDVCYLSDLYVDPSLRGGGAGRALIDAVLARAKTNGINEVYWTTEKTNNRAKGLYDQIASQLPFDIYSVDLPADKAAG